MRKSLFEDELINGMQQELLKQASSEGPSLVKAAECLHAALEIFEEQGLRAQADQVLHLLEKISRQQVPVAKTSKIHSVQQLMDAGITQRDLHEFTRGSPRAAAKLNLTLRRLGLSDHEIGEFLKQGSVMSEEDALRILNSSGPTYFLELESVAARGKHKKPSRPDKRNDPATKGLTPDKEVKNLLEHGHPLNVTMADTGFALDIPPYKENPGREDFLPEFAELFDSPNFDISTSDDDLMEMEADDNSIEVFEKENSMHDFEDERD